MAIIQAFLIVIEVVTSALLLGVIFLQKSKGSGMGTAFGGMGEAIFGTRMGNVLTKATVILGVTFLVNTTLLAWMGARRTPMSVVDRNPVAAPAAPMGAMPGGAGQGPGPEAMPVESPMPGAEDMAPVDFGGDAAMDVDLGAPAAEAVPVVEIPGADAPAPPVTPAAAVPAEAPTEAPVEATAPTS